MKIDYKEYFLEADSCDKFCKLILKDEPDANISTLVRAYHHVKKKYYKKVIDEFDLTIFELRNVNDLIENGRFNEENLEKYIGISGERASIFLRKNKHLLK